MKRLFVLLSCAALLWNCSNTVEEGSSPDVSFSADIVSIGTRTTFDSSFNVLWAEGDAIEVSNGTNTYTFVAKSAGASSKFNSSDNIAKDFFKATSFTANYGLPGGQIPSSFTYSSNPSSNLPMYGESESAASPRSLVFHNICGVLEITVADATNVAAVVVSSTSDLTGNVSVSGYQASVTGGGNTITVNIGTPSAETKKVYVPIVPGSHQLTIATKDGTDKTLRSITTLQAQTIAASTLYPIDMPAPKVEQNLSFDLNGSYSKTYDPSSLTFDVAAHLSKPTDAGTLTWSIIGGDSYASIDSGTGVVTVIKPGIVTVKVSAESTDNYEPAEKTCTLEISKGAQTIALAQSSTTRTISLTSSENQISLSNLIDGSKSSYSGDLEWTVASGSGFSISDGYIKYTKGGVTGKIKCKAKATDYYAVSNEVEYSVQVNLIQASIVLNAPSTMAINGTATIEVDGSSVFDRTGQTITWTVTANSNKNKLSKTSNSGCTVTNSQKDKSPTVQASIQANDFYSSATKSVTITVPKN